MEKAKKEIQIRYPNDNRLHNVIVYQVDRTLDDRIVISYYDVTDGNADSYSELVYVNGEWMKNSTHLDWNLYQFREFDPLFSNNIINSLPDKIEVAKPKEEIKQETEKPNVALQDTMVLEPPKHRMKHIQLISFANDGRDSINLYPTSFDSGKATMQEYSFDSCSVFFSEGMLSSGSDYSNLSNLDFKRVDISDDDKNDIFDYIKSLISKDGKVNISSNVIFKVETKSNILYTIEWSSCNSWKLFINVQSSDGLSVDVSDVSNASFPDDLSSALHYELPLLMSIKGNYYSNGVDLSKGNITK